MVHFAVLKILIVRKEHYCSSAQLSHNCMLEIFTAGGEKGAAQREIKTCRILQEVKSMKTDMKRTMNELVSNELCPNSYCKT